MNEEDAGTHEPAVMLIVRDRIAIATLREMAVGRFGNLVKAVVDIEREVMAVDADMHADEETVLLEDGSRQRDLWGINLSPRAMGRRASSSSIR